METGSTASANDPGALEFTGERYVPEVTGSIELEHMHRYVLARQFAVGKRVLDLACGEGYGSMQLSEVAATVTGIDVDLQAVTHAKSRYQRANLQFVSASATAIPIGDESFDLVVSFETIEHLAHHDEMLSEIRRVMTLDGVLLISSPNKLNYSDANSYSNPFHVKELYREDFERLLRRHFRLVTLSGQRIVYGSLILPDQLSRITPPDSHPASIGEFKPIYDFAITSNAADVASITSFLERDVGQSELATQMRERIRCLEMELADTYASRSWRLTAPLRRCLDIFHNLIGFRQGK